MNSFSVRLFTPAEFACVCTCQKAKSMFRGIWAGTAVIWNNDNLNTLFSWTIVFAFSHLSLAFSLSVSSFHISWLSSVGRCVCLSPQEDVVDQIPCLRVFKLWFPDTDTIPKKLFKTGLQSTVWSLHSSTLDLKYSKGYELCKSLKVTVFEYVKIIH